MAYERSQAEGVVLPLAGQAGGGEKGAKHENGLPGVQPSPRATFPNTPSAFREFVIGELHKTTTKIYGSSLEKGSLQAPCSGHRRRRTPGGVYKDHVVIFVSFKDVLVNLGL
jgi:hypothetical protein